MSVAMAVPAKPGEVRSRTVAPSCAGGWLGLDRCVFRPFLALTKRQPSRRPAGHHQWVAAGYPSEHYNHQVGSLPPTRRACPPPQDKNGLVRFLTPPCTAGRGIAGCAWAWESAVTMSSTRLSGRISVPAAPGRRSRSGCAAGCSRNLSSASRAASTGLTGPRRCRGPRGPSRSGWVDRATPRSSGLSGRGRGSLTANDVEKLPAQRVRQRAQPDRGWPASGPVERFQFCLPADLVRLAAAAAERVSPSRPSPGSAAIGFWRGQ